MIRRDGPPRVVALGLTVCLLVPVAVRAQAGEDTPALRRHHIELSGGIGWSGGYDIGGVSADLRSNAPGGSPPPFTLFRAASAVDGVTSGEARIGFSLTRRLVVEAGFRYARPGVTTSVSGDPEAPAVVLTERLAQYAIEAGVVWQVPRVTVGRMRPFVGGGAGYLRQLYADRTLVETGRVIYAGGGVRYWLRGGDLARRSLGVRGEVRATWRRDGVELADRTRVWPSASILLFWEP